MCNESSLLTSLVAFLTGHLWHKIDDVAQNVHLAILWIRRLQENGNDERTEYLRRTIRHQVSRLLEVARKQRKEAAFAAELTKGVTPLMTELETLWDPDPPSPQRINELPLVEDFDGLRGVKVCQVRFFRCEDENSWFGELQDGKWSNFACTGEVAYRSAELEDGVGGRGTVLVPVAVRIDVPKADGQRWAKECHDFAVHIRDNWQDHNLFGSQVFLRHEGPNSPSHRRITRIQSKRLRQK